jgi:hypothetical protein
MERHFEIWGSRPAQHDTPHVHLDTVNGPGVIAIQEAMAIVKEWHASGYYAHIIDMDNGGAHVSFHNGCVQPLKTDVK